MKISALAHTLPSQRLTNEWIVEKIRERSSLHLSIKHLDVLERRLNSWLMASGTKVRYTLAPGERAIDMVLRATRDALDRAGVPRDDIDFLIYTGVGRGWIEPASATVIQSEMGLRNATCFDVLDACASWLRALQVAHSYVRSGTYRTGVIVNCECGHYRAYADWEFRNVDELEHRYAAYTIGEVATATVVTDEVADDDFYFTFKTVGKYFDLCILPLPSVDDFMPGGANGHLVPGRFYARSRALLGKATRMLRDTFERDPRLRQGQYDICFGHDATQKMGEIVSRKLGVPGIYFSTHSEYGNTVSASVPLGMSLAQGQGRLNRGDRVAIVVGSAGMTVGFATFTF